MLSNLRSEGMAADDGLWLGDTSVSLALTASSRMAVLATVASPRHLGAIPDDCAHISETSGRGTVVKQASSPVDEQVRRLVPRMSRMSATKWIRLRLAFAIGVLVLLAIELSGHRSWPLFLLQGLLIVGIVVTSALDLRDFRGGRTAASGPPLA
jgi:hypothetical protein